MGKHHLWIFPNLTEDCGVIESFKPFIKHDVYDSTKELKEKARQKRREREEEEEENDSENENDKNNGFEIVDTHEGNDGENIDIEENVEEYDENNEDFDEDNQNNEESDDVDADETKKEK